MSLTQRQREAHTVTHHVLTAAVMSSMAATRSDSTPASTPRQGSCSPADKAADESKAVAVAA